MLFSVVIYTLWCFPVFGRSWSVDVVYSIRCKPRVSSPWCDWDTYQKIGNDVLCVNFRKRLLCWLKHYSSLNVTSVSFFGNWVHFIAEISSLVHFQPSEGHYPPPHIRRRTWHALIICFWVSQGQIRRERALEVLHYCFYCNAEENVKIYMARARG